MWLGPRSEAGLLRSIEERMGDYSSSSNEAHSLRYYAVEGGRLDGSSFRAAFGNAFILQHGPSTSQKGKGDSDISTGEFHTIRTGEHPVDQAIEFRVFPVRRVVERSSHEFISVGRADNNDVVILDLSVTKYHAFFNEDDDGRFFILDAASKNGTYLNDRAVPGWGKGDPVEICSGDSIRMGGIHFTFLLADEFRQLVVKLFRALPQPDPGT